MQPSKALADALRAALAEMDLPWPEKLVVEAPKNPAHGDLSTNAALLLAKSSGKNPRDLAAELGAKLVKLDVGVEKAEAAGPGFCNVTFKPEFWRKTVTAVENAGDSWGKSAAGAGRKVLVEYVSANPTGPLHVGHGRGAALGDGVTRLLRAAGYDAHTEYYINDAGKQMRLLGLSVWLRALELAGKKPEFPDDYYRGDYIRDIAAKLLETRPEIIDLPETEALEICREFGGDEILTDIKKDLNDFRCEHERYFSEKSLVDDGSVDSAFKALAKTGRYFEKDGAAWFDSQSLGDDQNRVLRKSDGSLTYFATDIAYHKNKFARGFDRLIDVWGADHHGYVARMRAAIADMGENPENFDVLLIQLVNLLRDGEKIPMSTRAGQFVTLADVLNEVGADAARFMFLSRSPDSPLDFDLELAKKRAPDNPVYYVQYAHARAASLLRRARDGGVELPAVTPPEILARLDTPDDMTLLRKIAEFEETVTRAAGALSPHHVTRYLLELATALHAYYGQRQIINPDDKTLTIARLALARAAAQTIRNGLNILGVEAPEQM